MALIPINVTLTSQEPNSGPLYDIYYSIDGTNYILALADANLPDVGSSVVVNVEDTYCRIRLVDASSACEGTTNTIDFGICCSPAVNPVFRLEYSGYTAGSTIWSGSDTLPKSASVVGGGLTAAPGVSAWAFDGYNDYFTISSGALAGMQPVNNLTEANDFTITFTGYFFSGSGEKALLYAGSNAIPSGRAYYNFLDQPNKMSLVLGSSLNFAQPGTIKAFLNVLPSSSLQSIAMKQEGSNTSIYQNGTLVTSSAWEWGLFNRISATTTQAIFFGDNTSGVGTTFNGALNSFNIYSRSLSDSEIYSDYLYYAQNCVTPTTTTTTTTTSTTTTSTTTTTTLGPCSDYYCGSGSVIFTTASLLYGIYPSQSVCPSSNECGTYVYSAYDRPNRFNLYDSVGLVATSGWVGYANYSGPWGSDLNVSPNGSFPYDFSSTSGRYVEVEYGNADPADPLSDSAEWSLTCGTCVTTTTTAPPVQVSLVYGFMQPCVGGTIDDFMGASVILNGAVNVDTEVVVNVSYVYPGNACSPGAYTQQIYLTIPSGSASDNFNACLNGIYFSGGAEICDACVASCNNPAVDISTASC